jgi:hypothetical protein
MMLFNFFLILKIDWKTKTNDHKLITFGVIVVF